MGKAKTNKYNLIIFPYKCNDYKKSISQKEILFVLINYFDQKDICIYRQDDDYYGLYGKWFPFVDIKKSEKLEKDTFADNQVIILNLSGHQIPLLNEEYKYYAEVEFQQLSERKIHLYFTACQIAHKWSKSSKVKYWGADIALFRILAHKFASDLDFYSEKTLYQNDGATFYILDDGIENETLEHIKQNMDSHSVILFLNDQLKYIFYQAKNSENMDHIVPYPITYYTCDESGVKKMKLDEAVLYAYTLNDDFKKELISTKIQRVMNRIGIESDRTSIENAYLRGMLEATERKVIYLQQQLSELKE